MADRSKPASRGEERILVPLLLVMTFVTGVVDAVSILRLGHVFIANMTGNVVFLGFAFAGAPGFSVLASLVAVGAFLVGAATSARIAARSQRQALARIATVEATLFAGATVVAVFAIGAAARDVVTALLALAMGGQNATARKLAVPDLTTTVLTLTLTGLVSDPADLGRPGSHALRRAGAVAAMLTGAIAGALLVLHTSTGWALGAGAAILAAVAVTARWPLGRDSGTHALP